MYTLYSCTVTLFFLSEFRRFQIFHKLKTRPDIGTRPYNCSGHKSQICQILTVRGIFSFLDIKNTKVAANINTRTILDNNYVDFLQFQRYFTPQAELEEAFIYIIHKPIDFFIDFSCRLKT